MDPHGREPTAPRAWRPRFRRLWPHAAVGCVVTLVLAWALPLALASRGVGPMSARPVDWYLVRPHAVHTTPELGAGVTVRRTALADLYVAFPSQRAPDGRVDWPTEPLQTYDDWNLRRAITHTPSWSVRLEPARDEYGSWDRIDTQLTGWPFRAFAAELWHREGGRLGHEGMPLYRHALVLGVQGGESVLVPLRPLAVGLALDVLFWTTCSWIALVAPREFRRRRAERYERCAQCGFTVGAREVRRPDACPECGTAFARDPLGFARVPEMHFQNAYAWLVLVSSLDIMLTAKILQRGGIEVNPVAALVIDMWGMQGAIAFKFALMTWVVIVCEVLARLRHRAAIVLAVGAVALSAVPVAWSLFLLCANALG
jgi:hypothetical protein